MRKWQTRRPNAGKAASAAGQGGFLDMMVGAAGFEPTTPTPPVWCATRLRYAPPKLPAPPIRQGKPGCACIAAAPGEGNARPANRSEERRVGKEGGSTVRHWGSPQN